MLSLHVGHDTDYLTEAVAKGREGYYTGAVAAGEPPGIWFGRGAETLGLSGEVDAGVMKALFAHSLDPRDPSSRDRSRWDEAARLGNPPRRYRSVEEIYAAMAEAHPHATEEELAELRIQAEASARQSVAFYDLTISAAKSHTVAWVACERLANEARAAGNSAEAELWGYRAFHLDQAVLVGHRVALEYMQDHACYARAGHHGGGGGRWVDGEGLVCAQWPQHDSRDRDPQLHAHGTIWAKVRCADGKWRAIDSSLLTACKPGAAAAGERAMEAYLWQTLGIRWESRPDGKAREIVGVDADATGLFSKRRAAITPAAQKLIAQFRAENGREPNGRERARLCERATLATRQAKSHGGETREGQIARWADEHAVQLGRELGEVARTVFAEPTPAPAQWSSRDVITRALGAVEEAHQSWTRGQLQREISKALPGNLGVSPEQVRPLLDGLTDQALGHARLLNPSTSLQGFEPEYYRADGSCVFSKPSSQRYATDNQLLGVAELRASTLRRGAPTWNTDQAAALLDRYARSGRALTADQAAAVTGILTSGAAVEVLTAPAGTGKSYLVGVLADAWTHHPPEPPTETPGAPSPPGSPGAGESPAEECGRRVFGLAYGQRQTDVLTEEGVTARNITAWLAGQTRIEAGRAVEDDEAFRLHAGDLVVVDEAGAADNPDLLAVDRRCAAAGAKLLLVGDPRQNGAVGAGGAFADIAERGITYELAEVRRFGSEWEGPASLRLRDGDTTVVGEYAKHGRLVEAGTAEQAEAAAARAWLADTIAGRDALLVVGSNQAAARVSAALRAELVRLGRVDEVGVKLGMQDEVAGVGDLVQARRNAWHLAGWAGNTEAPVNRQAYRVTDLHPDGRGLTVARVLGRDTDGAEQLAGPIELPGSYVAQHVTLAYACTVHAAQGRTVDTGYTVIAPSTGGAAAYVGLTRGRESNVGFAVTRNLAETAETGQTHAVAPRTAAAVLADVIRPPELDHSRTGLTEAESAAARARSTAARVDPMIEVIGDSCAGRVGRWLDQLTATGQLPDHHRTAIAADPARGTLDQLLRAAELAGHDPQLVLQEAVGQGSLDQAASVAQVLHWRVRTALADQLTPRVASYADLLPRDLPDASRPGLEALAAAADARRVELGAQLAADPPQWAREALGPLPDEPADRAHWEQRAGWAGSWRELVGHTDPADPLGAAPPAGLAEKHALFRAAHHALDLPGAGAEEENMSEGRLRARVAAHDRELAWAPPYVADQLEATHGAWRKADTDATLLAARADTTADPKDAEQLWAAADDARRQAEQHGGQLAQLDIADHARAAWWVETAVTRDKAHRSREALAIRGIDLANPADRVTAAEWLAAHRAEQADSDPHREVRDEHDLTDHPANQTHTSHLVSSHEPPERLPDNDQLEDHRGDQNTPAAEPAVDSPGLDRRRRMPIPDETADTVNRAQQTLTVIAARRYHEAIAAAELDPDAEEDTRRAELARWADHDTTADNTTNDDRADTDPTDDRGRRRGRDRDLGRGDAAELVRD